MLYTVVAIALAFVTAGLTRGNPSARGRISVGAFTFGTGAVAVGVVTGNIGFFYGGAFVAVYGLVLLFALVIGLIVESNPGPFGPF
jgi:hypothetical protein